MPLPLNKSGILHCGNNNLILQYILDGHPLPVMSRFKDLGILKNREQLTVITLILWQHKATNYLAQYCTPLGPGSQPYSRQLI